ncbi:MAG: cation:proton antiporter, partial [Acidobacteria bacterium]|nr:cation:proton antiporter [Acidobacteriota bacterium]
MRLKLSASSLLACLAALAASAHAARAETAQGAGGGGASHGLDPLVLVGVAAMLVVAKLCGEAFERLRQPAVLGELCGGILLGALGLAGVGAIETLKADATVNALAEIGVIILLFEVGLESNLGELLEVWRSSLLVAVAGVVVPFLLGWGVASLFLPGEVRL